jgi:hypothetical protein
VIAVTITPCRDHYGGTGPAAGRRGWMRRRRVADVCMGMSPSFPSSNPLLPIPKCFVPFRATLCDPQYAATVCNSPFYAHYHTHRQE